jgi:cytochrome c-type biogenesis protein CcmH
VKKHYVLIGIGVAALAAATVVVIGAGTGGEGISATNGAAAATQPLPSGHPSANGRGTADSAASDSSVQRTIIELKAAVKTHPRDPDLLLKLGDAWFLGQRYREAGRAFRSVLRLAPGNAAATVRLAMVWHADGDTPRALTALKNVLVKTPQDQEAHFFLAIVYFSQKQAELAKAEWIIAARLDPRSAIGRRSRSFVDLLEGSRSTPPSSGGAE